MKKTLIALAMALVLPLAACDSSTDATPEEQIINAIVQGCNWRPDNQSVLAILGAFGPEVSITGALALQVADAVCAQVGTPPEEGTFAAPETPKTVKIKVGDKVVEVTGEFVR